MDLFDLLKGIAADSSGQGRFSPEDLDRYFRRLFHPAPAGTGYLLPAVLHFAIQQLSAVNIRCGVDYVQVGWAGREAFLAAARNLSLDLEAHLVAEGIVPEDEAAAFEARVAALPADTVPSRFEAGVLRPAFGKDFGIQAAAPRTRFFHNATFNDVSARRQRKIGCLALCGLESSERAEAILRRAVSYLEAWSLLVVFDRRPVVETVQATVMALLPEHEAAILAPPPAAAVGQAFLIAVVRAPERRFKEIEGRKVVQLARYSPANPPPPAHRIIFSKESVPLARTRPIGVMNADLVPTGLFQQHFAPNDMVTMSTHGVAVPNGSIGGVHMVVDGDGRYLEEAAASMAVDKPNLVRRGDDSFFMDRVNVGRVLRGTWIPLPNYNTHHSHWLLECVKRLCFADRLPVRPKPRLVAIDRLNDEQRAFLRVLGYRDEDIVLRARDEWVRCEMLLVLIQESWLFDDVALAFFESLAERAPPSPLKTGRIYVARTDARAYRNLLNEDETIDIARRHGFEIVVPSEFSLEEEIAIFKGAHTIVGPLGAGLLNAIFSPRGARLAALTSRFYPQKHIPVICALKDMQLYYQFGTGIDSFTDVWGSTHNNFIIDPAGFDRLLRRMVA